MKIKDRIKKIKSEKRDNRRDNFGKAKTFWNKEYKQKGVGDNAKFNLSTEPAEDLKKFTRWLERNTFENYINNKTFFVDAGCGNGRNAIFLNGNFDAKGIGYDISEEAIQQAKEGLQRETGKQEINFFPQNLNAKIQADDESTDIVLDMIASHVLRKDEREFFKTEVLRILKQDGYYFLKSLLLDDDAHAKQMIRDDAGKAGEENSYMHPTMGHFEHVPTEKKLRGFYEQEFFIDKVERSFAHKIKGKPNKRRYIVLYLRKK
jgi:SAM-dependent methyltransferase